MMLCSALSSHLPPAWEWLRDATAESLNRVVLFDLLTVEIDLRGPGIIMYVRHVKTRRPGI